MDCKRKQFQESLLVLGLGPAEARQPTAAKNTRTKGSFIGGGKGGRQNGGMKGGGTLYIGI